MWRRLFSAPWMFAGLCMLAVATPAAAFRDCCQSRSIPPRLVGVNFTGPIDGVLERLVRAGFQDYDPGSRRIAGLGDLTGAPGTSPTALEPGEISGVLLSPAIARFELACGGSGGATGMPMGGHPNGARMLRTVIAVVTDLDRSCERLEGAWTGAWSMPAFGPAYDDPTMGARVREAHFGLGALRLLEPIDPHGPAARWLAEGGPRWIGFEVEVDDLEDTERWLYQERVTYQVATQPAACVLRIDPETLDGLLVEFVSKRDRGDSGKCDKGPRF